MTKKIEFTDRAKEQIKIVTSQNQSKKFFRISVKGGGCSGFKYQVDFIAPPKDESIYKTIESDGLRVLVDKKSYLFLVGTEIDYKETMMSSGFEFNSPMVKSACGCGESVGF